MSVYLTLGQDRTELLGRAEPEFDLTLRPLLVNSVKPIDAETPHSVLGSLGGGVSASVPHPITPITKKKRVSAREGRNAYPS